jgi:hypothetical protein
LRIGKLLKTERDSTTVGKNKIPKIKHTEIPRLPSTSFIGSSPCFPMVHFITPNGQRIMSYGYQRMARWLNQEKLSRLDLPTQISIWQSFAMSFLETLNTKVADNDLTFPLVTRMAFSDARFGSYGILKSVRGAENFLDRLCRSANDQVFRAEDAQNLKNIVYKFRRPLTYLSNAYSHAHFR